MDIKKAKELAKPYMVQGPDGKKTQTLCVMSDGGVYVNNDLKAMQGIAKQSQKDLFVILGDASKGVISEKEAPKKEAPKAEAPKQEAKKKATKKKKK